jgi:serine/threonine-protein kinase
MAVETPPPGRLLRPSGLDGPSSGPTPRIDPLIGKTIDNRYFVERGIGEGGMGIVYAGRHTAIGKRVAIKVLRSEMVRDPELAARFLQEARAASSIGNPHIVDISDFGQLPDGSTYFVMELLEGKSLGELLAEAGGPLPVARVVHIAKQIAQGLGAAHAAKIVHRDLKPDNVMLVRRGDEEDFAKILDFGIAKVGGGAPKMTQVGSVFGTPHYMSPEQGNGSVVDHRTDIYALGVITYEMASGWVPFDGADMLLIVHQHMHSTPPSLRARVPHAGIPPALDAIVTRCLAKDPAARYPTMEKLVEDLVRLERGESAPPSAQSAQSSPAPPSRRWPMILAMALVSTLSIALVATVLVRGGRHHAVPAPSSLATPTPTPPPAPAPAPPPAPAPAPPPAPAPAPPPAPAPALAPTASSLHEVLVSVVPVDATITRDGENLGVPPIALHLGEGEAVDLVLSRKGYRSKAVHVDGTDPKLVVTLEVLPAGPSGASSHKPGHDDVGEFSKSF